MSNSVQEIIIEICILGLTNIPKHTNRHGRIHVYIIILWQKRIFARRTIPLLEKTVMFSKTIDGIAKFNITK